MVGVGRGEEGIGGEENGQKGGCGEVRGRDRIGGLGTRHNT